MELRGKYFPKEMFWSLYLPLDFFEGLGFVLGFVSFDFVGIPLGFTVLRPSARALIEDVLSFGGMCRSKSNGYSS